MMQRILGQILVYPAVSRRGYFKTDGKSSYLRYAENFGLTREKVRWYWEQYTGVAAPRPGGEVASELRYAAVMDSVSVEEMKGLPPALVVLASHDVIRDDGEEHARRLKRAQVPVEQVIVPFTIHGLWEKRALDRTGQGLMLHAVADFIIRRVEDVSRIKASQRLNLD